MKSRRWILAATVLGSSMAFIDGTIVNVALPVMQEKIGTSVAGAQWIVEAYALLLSALVLVGGALGDRFGRRRIFLVGNGIFALSSVACGLAPGIGVLVVARAVQGTGAALLVPSSLAILGAAFSDGARGRAIGTWSALTAVTTAGGPLLGGWLAGSVSWRAIFFLNVPLAVVVGTITIFRIPESRDPNSSGLDLPGAVLATFALAAIVFGLLEESSAGWGAARVWGSLSAGMLAGAVFVATERRRRDPMVPPALFRSRSFDGANLLTFFLYAALSAALFFLPFDLIQAHGFTATQAGAALMPLVVLISTLSRFAGAISDRLGPRPCLIAGPAVAAVGCFLLSLAGPDARYAAGFLPGLVVLGLGMAATVAPLTTTVLASVPRAQAGLASGFNNAVSRVGGLLVIAVLGVVAQPVFEGALDRRLAASGFSSPSAAVTSAERGKLGGAKPSPALAEPEKQKARESIAVALVAATRVVMLLSCGLALLASISAIVLIDARENGNISASPRP